MQSAFVLRSCKVLRRQELVMDASTRCPVQLAPSETWPSGRRHSPAKGAYGPKPVSRVRIPLSPPEKCLRVGHFLWQTDGARTLCSLSAANSASAAKDRAAKRSAAPSLWAGPASSAMMANTTGRSRIFRESSAPTRWSCCDVDPKGALANRSRRSVSKAATTLDKGIQHARPSLGWCCNPAVNSGSV